MSKPSRLPPLNSLKAFEAAARHLSFKVAAEEMGVTQSAVAQQIRGLEAELGFKLFNRSPRSLSLTNEGRCYHVDIRRAFEIIYRATDDLKPQPIRLTISTTPTFASKWLIPRLSDFMLLHQHVDLHILATERVSNFQVDNVHLAVRYASPPFGPGLTAQLLFEQEIVAVCNPTLIKAGQILSTVEDLGAFSLLHDSHNFWPEFIRLHFGGGSCGQFKGISFNQTSHAIEAAIAGQGIVLANRYFVEEDISAGRLAVILKRSLRGPCDFYLVYPTYRQSPAIHLVVSWMLNAASVSTLRPF